MIPAYNYNQIIEELQKAFQSRYEENSSVRMIGFLFSPPHTRIAKEEIIPRLHYFHHLSGNSFDFFCAGYGGYLPQDEYPDIIELGVTKPNYWQEIPWAYSDKVFISLCKEFSHITCWHYSGESDLILANAICDKESQIVTLDFSSALVLDLELMLKDEPTLSIGRIFENICRYADTYPSENSTFDFSDRSGLKALRSSLIDGIVDSLPKPAGLLWKRGIHYRSINLNG